MKTEDVPQDDNYTLGGHRKGVYARDAAGRMVLVSSRGWEVEEIVTDQALHTLASQAAQAHARALSGLAAPLEYWMYARRMDPELLAQTTGLWRWRVRRHLRAEIFARLSPALLQRYADALGLPPAQLATLPPQP
ncbi:MAG: helix-turn-helix transcriptional regulator [Candidatus Dactylopiibacterium sp.]|nr:helix-turn-helix transcriptional regulator [Candidatus Dactylopiibacterium sp.]